MLKKVSIAAFMLLLFVMAACDSRNYYHIDIDTVEPIAINRFDSLVYEFCNLQECDSVKQAEIAARGGDFWSIYACHVIDTDTFDAPLFRQGITKFYHRFDETGIFDETLKRYADAYLESYGLAQISARYIQLFPYASTPKFQFHLSGLSQQSIVTMDSLVSIAIDCYLDSCSWYEERYYKYELPQHRRSRILPDVSEVLLRNAMQPCDGGTLLDAIVYEGRIAYLVAALMANNTPQEVIGYTREQYDWCVENELLVWTAMIEQGDLFKCDNITLRKYIQPAPFTATITSDAPGRIGRWVGWRIVEEYARKQGLTPQQVVADKTCAIDILRLSGYDGK